ncbi:MAG: MFS transporter [Patescibacteria group bacterium]
MKSKQKIPRTVLVLGFVALASGFGQDLVSSVLPGYLALLAMSRADIGLIDGLLQGATNLFRFVSGWMSDRVESRKRLAFFGYALSSLARPLLAFGSGFLPFAALRVLDGIGKGTKDAPRDALVADAAASGESGRAFGFHRMVDTAGSVLGPLLAFALLALFLPSLATYRLILALSIVPGVVALGLIWFGIREPAHASRVASRATTPLPWQFWLFTMAMAIATITKINDSLFLVRAQDLGVSPTAIPLLFGGFTLIYAVLSYPIGIWSDRIGKMPLLAAGWMVLALVEFGFSVDPSMPMTLVLFAGYGLFFALTEGSARAYIADTVAVSGRGFAYGIYYTVLGLALIIGGYVLGSIWDKQTPEIAFRIAAIGSLVGGLILWRLIPKSLGTRAG